MNYINKDERVKSKRQFILLFSLAVILTVTLASPFFTPTGVKQPTEQPTTKVPVTVSKKHDTIIKKVLVTDTANQKLVVVLQERLDEKNGQVNRLQQQISSLQRAPRKIQNKPEPSFNEISFLRLALRSQTSLVDKLKRENEQLKQQNKK